MPTHDDLIGVIVFLTILTTLTIGLRILVRTRLGGKGAFGWDDVFLLISYVGFLLFEAFVIQTMYYGYISTDSQPWYDEDKAVSYNNATNDTCYFISATVKISVALVLYRLVELAHRTIRWILIMDIAICVVYNLATMLVLSLGCMEGTIYTFSTATCQTANYASEASYVIWNTFHVVIPIFILWNIQISWKVKAGVVFLFGVGFLAVFASIMRLLSYVDAFQSGSSSISEDIWYTRATWTCAEHGLSIFASSILALTPVIKMIASSCKSLAKSIGSGKRSFTYGSEMWSINVQKDVSVDSKTRADSESLRGTSYIAEVNGSHGDSRKTLVDGQKACSEDGNLV